MPHGKLLYSFKGLELHCRKFTICIEGNCIAVVCSLVADPQYDTWT